MKIVPSAKALKLAFTKNWLSLKGKIIIDHLYEAKLLL
jgi:hypothetical protein